MGKRKDDSAGPADLLTWITSALHRLYSAQLCNAAHYLIGSLTFLLKTRSLL